MTLLIGTVARSRKPHIVVTADGRSTGFDGLIRSVKSNTQQKIFPVPDLPVVIAHHGENEIAAMPVEQFVPWLLKDYDGLRTSTIDGIADYLQGRADEAVVATLRRITTSKQVGFWIAGFGHGRREPSLCEFSWKKEPTTGEITTKNLVHGNLVFGGDARVLIDEYRSMPVDGMYRWDRIPDQSSSYAVRLHNKLYGIAEQRQASQHVELFGGHKHQILVMPEGWEWKVTPTQTEPHQ